MQLPTDYSNMLQFHGGCAVELLCRGVIAADRKHTDSGLQVGSSADGSTRESMWVCDL